MGKKITYDTVRALALRLPEVQESTSYADWRVLRPHFLFESLVGEPGHAFRRQNESALNFARLCRPYPRPISDRSPTP